MVCAKQEGEQCGGLFNMLGHCDEGLKCEKDSESGSPFQRQVPGVCQSKFFFDKNLESVVYCCVIIFLMTELFALSPRQFLEEGF